MSFVFKPAVRERISLLVGLVGPSGGGKTRSAMRIATGLAGPAGRIAFIDTEAGRAKHYAGAYRFDHCDFTPPFSPDRYREAIVAADQAGYDVIVVDSFSHEWAGDGGCQDMHEEALVAMVTDRNTGEVNTRRMEALSAPAWREPKMKHKRMMSRLLQCRAHILLCLRAEQKVRFAKVRDDRGRERTVIEDAGFQPICEKHAMFEVTCSFMLLPDRPGVPDPIKLPDELKHAFPAERQITEETGRALAEWAKGGAAQLATADPAGLLAQIDRCGTLDALDALRESGEFRAVFKALSPADKTRVKNAGQAKGDALRARARRAGGESETGDLLETASKGA